MSEEQVRKALEVLPGWTLVEGGIQKEFRFSSYLKGLEFASSMGRISEKQDHHPDMLVRWRRVKLSWYTHSIKGLSKNDFIMAAKAEVEYSKSLEVSKSS